jgi:hypothetical protein
MRCYVPLKIFPYISYPSNSLGICLRASPPACSESPSDGNAYFLKVVIVKTQPHQWWKRLFLCKSHEILGQASKLGVQYKVSYRSGKGWQWVVRCLSPWRFAWEKNARAWSFKLFSRLKFRTCKAWKFQAWQKLKALASTIVMWTLHMVKCNLHFTNMYITNEIFVMWV